MKYVPHEYQRFATDFIVTHPTAAIFLDMGMGKSSITLTAIERLMYQEFEVRKVLIIAPLRVAKNTWPAEIQKWDHLNGLTWSVIIGTQQERMAALRREADIYLINRENTQWLIEKSGMPFDYDMVVIDELSSFKSWQSKRFRSLMKVRPFVRRIVGLTGTPSSNGLMDLFAEFRVLDMGQRLGRFIGQYRNAFFKPDRMNGPIVYSYKPLPGAEEEIYRRIGDITISMKLGTTARYLGLPSYGYQIGDFTVDHDGNIIGEDFGALQDFLRRNGYVNDEPAADQEAVTEAQPDEEAPADSEAEPITSMDISIPVRDATVTQLKNLIFMLHSRQTLINRMTDSGCLNIPDILIDRLQESTPETPDALTDLLDDCKAMEGLTGFDFRDGKVSMTFPFDETQPERWTTYANLLNRIFDAAMKATRVFPERVEPDDQNEKYLAHVWLQRLGYHGADFKAERKILLGHLKGYCAFGSGDKMQAHKEKYTAIRRERRLAEQEAAVLEVMVEEANTNE